MDKARQKGHSEIVHLLERADHTSQHIPEVVTIIDGGTQFVDAIFYGIIVLNSLSDMSR